MKIGILAKMYAIGTFGCFLIVFLVPVNIEMGFNPIAIGFQIACYLLGYGMEKAEKRQRSSVDFHGAW